MIYSIFNCYSDYVKFFTCLSGWSFSSVCHSFTARRVHYFSDVRTARKYLQPEKIFSQFPGEMPGKKSRTKIQKKRERRRFCRHVYLFPRAIGASLQIRDRVRRLLKKEKKIQPIQIRVVDKFSFGWWVAIPDIWLRSIAYNKRITILFRSDNNSVSFLCRMYDCLNISAKIFVNSKFEPSASFT